MDITVIGRDDVVELLNEVPEYSAFGLNPKDYTVDPSPFNIDKFNAIVTEADSIVPYDNELLEDAVTKYYDEDGATNEALLATLEGSLMDKPLCEVLNDATTIARGIHLNVLVDNVNQYDKTVREYLALEEDQVDNLSRLLEPEIPKRNIRTLDDGLHRIQGYNIARELIKV